MFKTCREGRKLALIFFRFQKRTYCEGALGRLHLFWGIWKLAYCSDVDEYQSQHFTWLIAFISWYLAVLSEHLFKVYIFEKCLCVNVVLSQYKSTKVKLTSMWIYISCISGPQLVGNYFMFYSYLSFEWYIISQVYLIEV